MNSIRKTHIYNICVLKYYVARTIGMDCPIEIVKLIVWMIYTPIKISCGYNYTILVGDKTYVWGCNDGRLGLGDNDNRDIPSELVLDKPIISVACGLFHTVALTASQTIYVWGRNGDGQLGLGSKRLNSQNVYTAHADRSTVSRLAISLSWEPQELETVFVSDDVTNISCGEFHTVISTVRNKIYVWGGNCFGQLGLGHTFGQCIPRELILYKTFVSSVIQISCGSLYTVILVQSCALHIRNRIYVWGRNNYGQLGLGDNDDKNFPQELVLSESIVSISCGQNHTIALAVSKKIYIWGNNHYGQLGLGTNIGYNTPQKLALLDAVSISCGLYHTCVLTNSNYIYIWGCNGEGQLGLGLGRGNNQYSPKKLVFAERIRSIICGVNNTIALMSDDTIYVWGDNSHSQLGLGFITINTDVPRKLEC